MGEATGVVGGETRSTSVHSHSLRHPWRAVARRMRTKENLCPNSSLSATPDQATATEAYNQVMVLNKDFVVKLTGLAIVNVDAEGQGHVETPQKIVGVSAASGALWGMLIGLLFFVPGVGLLLGGAMGALFGKLGRPGSTTSSGLRCRTCSDRATAQL